MVVLASFAGNYAFGTGMITRTKNGSFHVDFTIAAAKSAPQKLAFEPLPPPPWSVVADLDGERKLGR
jgi:hypothetical protein